MKRCLTDEFVRTVVVTTTLLHVPSISSRLFHMQFKAIEVDKNDKNLRFTIENVGEPQVAKNNIFFMKEVSRYILHDPGFVRIIERTFPFSC